ncbi:NAD(P)/FAD-dependent oxidoreductase [Mesorhizobium sp. LHD-90]|uniref:NAD(P)/FAD-dependent oxidoreductase n=1 Tax=Mesorhizobium sp. LHD-90 TaxID=3071414 RepID=UPI0027DF2BB4|nr:NAD(P)/FAD-dependent oxidoreductase [Mesorhizobium sp. LHD-90]MDQ6432965.1 NAD(P)/FAD-dependent oxidoreductase [Mesorhizobium sp. LHD-90]
MNAQQHHVVIVGAGFGGMEAVAGLRNSGARITLIDQRNHHLFQPLLYQVATTSLATSEIAWPIRHLLKRRKDVTTLLAEVVGVDTAGKRVLLDDGSSVSYDTLVLATGARHAYFGHDEWEPFAPGLKTIEDATTIRRHILAAFEKAEREPDPQARAALLTFVIIGGGPTGVELAGTIAELAHDTLRGEFRNIDTREARVVLVEAGERVLAGFKPELSAYAKTALERLGVTIKFGRPVTDCSAEGVTFDGRLLPAKTIIWAAGVAASPAARWLGAESDRAGRTLVEEDLSVPGHPDIFVVGDAAHVAWKDGKLVPGVAPAAKQQGRHVAATVRTRLSGDAAPRPFRYDHSGDLATIGKRAAAIDFGWFRMTGWPAWWLWGIAHIYYLIGFRYRLAVSLNWLWIYMTGQRSARLITQGSRRQAAP